MAETRASARGANGRNPSVSEDANKLPCMIPSLITTNFPGLFDNCFQLWNVAGWGQSEEHRQAWLKCLWQKATTSKHKPTSSDAKRHERRQIDFESASTCSCRGRS